MIQEPAPRRPPPSDAKEWADRAAAMDAIAPGFSRFAPGLPIGWFPLVEEAAAAMAPFFASGGKASGGYAKEKFGSMRWSMSLSGPDGTPLAWDDPACAPLHAACLASETTCALTGKPGAPDRGTGWWLVLSPEAIVTRASDREDFGKALYPDWARAADAQVTPPLLDT